MSAGMASNQWLLKKANRMMIVRRLCARPGLSRSDLAVELGMPRSTVTTFVRELLAEGWLMHRGEAPTGEVGRRPIPLYLDPQRLRLIGAEVGVGQLRVVATSLSGDVLDRVCVGFDPRRGPAACIDIVASTLLAMHERVAGPGRRVIGLGIGLPGGVDAVRGVLQFAPNLGWRNLPVGSLLLRKLNGTTLDGIPMFIQNEADAAAVGELEFNAAAAASPLIYLSMDRGLGAGVIVGDQLLGGSRGFAGEVGHVVLEVDGPLCSCGRRGCAEALISLPAMSGAPDAVAQAGRHLGVLLQNLAVAYDPGCIVLGGARIGLGDRLLQPALATLTAFAAAANLSTPLVRVSRFGAEAVAVGAAALARHRLTRPVGPGAAARTSERRARLPVHLFQPLAP